MKERVAATTGKVFQIETEALIKLVDLYQSSTDRLYLSENPKEDLEKSLFLIEAIKDNLGSYEKHVHFMEESDEVIERNPQLSDILELFFRQFDDLMEGCREQVSLLTELSQSPQNMLEKLPKLRQLVERFATVVRSLSQQEDEITQESWYREIGPCD